MSNIQEPGGMYFPSDDQESDENQRGIINYENIPQISDHQLSLWLHNVPTFSSIPMINSPSSFEVPLPFPGEIPYNLEENITLHGLEKGESSGTKRKHASMHTKERDEDEARENSDTSDECKQRKRTRSTGVERRDRASILDAAIKYIQTLQYQIQMMSMGAGLSPFHSPWMMPQLGQQGMQIPSLPFINTGPASGTGMGYGMGMGMYGMFSSSNFPMSQMGLPSPCLMASATSGFPGISEADNAVQYPGNVLEPLQLTTCSMDWAPWYSTSFPSSGSQCAMQLDTCPPKNSKK
ncbi:hypothetical protein DH2020_049394 [Rehmannia glutinosa]|uniref:BHLH domain-containing protein n=1 Tax=Rehmannia glutinosa TaxID=99300 RepID=A0ABR0U3F5_REHGL